MPSHCRHCGEPLAPQDRFCGECGKAVESPPARESDETISDGFSHVISRKESTEKKSKGKKFLYVLLFLFVLGGTYILALYLWNAKLSNPLFRERSVSLVFDSTGNTLAAGCADGMIRKWNLGSGLEEDPIHASSKGILTLAFDPKQGTLLCRDADNVLMLLDPKKRTRIGKADWLQRQKVFCTAFSGDLRTIAFESEKNALMLCDLRGRIKHTLKANHVRALSLNHDARILAVGDYRKVLLLDCQTGITLCTLNITKGTDAMTFTPDGNTLAVGGFKRDIELFDTKTGSKTQTLPWSGVFIESLAFSPSGRVLAATGGSGGGTWGIFLFDVTTGKKLKVFRLSPLWKRALAIAGF